MSTQSLWTTSLASSTVPAKRNYYRTINCNELTSHDIIISPCSDQISIHPLFWPLPPLTIPSPLPTTPSSVQPLFGQGQGKEWSGVVSEEGLIRRVDGRKRTRISNCTLVLQKQKKHTVNLIHTYRSLTSKPWTRPRVPFLMVLCYNPLMWTPL